MPSLPPSVSRRERLRAVADSLVDHLIAGRLAWRVGWVVGHRQPPGRGGRARAVDPHGDPSVPTGRCDHRSVMQAATGWKTGWPPEAAQVGRGRATAVRMTIGAVDQSIEADGGGPSARPRKPSTVTGNCCSDPGGPPKPPPAACRAGGAARLAFMARAGGGLHGAAGRRTRPDAGPLRRSDRSRRAEHLPCPATGRGRAARRGRITLPDPSHTVSGCRGRTARIGASST